MATIYLKTPDGIFLRSSEQVLDIGRDMPIGTYNVKQNPMTKEFYLIGVDGFKRAPKLYGDVVSKATRILTTFSHRSASTGVLLSGEMGSGKTMLARELSIRGADEGLSTIIVAEPFSGAEFNEFIQKIDVPAIVIFDEFEKMYDEEGQEKMLTLLDGVFPSKKLFVLTCNDMWKIDKHIINRPGRIFYHVQYKGLEEDFIKQYCDDALVNKRSVPDVLRLATTFTAFNFDMLKALVEELNRYNTTVADAVQMLNMTPAGMSEEVFDVKIFLKGVLVQGGYHTVYHGNPLNGKPVSLSYYGNKDNDSDDDDDYGYDAPESSVKVVKNKLQNGVFKFTTNDLKKIEGGELTFSNHPDVTVVLSKQQRQQFSFDRYAF